MGLVTLSPLFMAFALTGLQGLYSMLEKTMLGDVSKFILGELLHIIRDCQKLGLQVDWVEAWVNKLTDMNRCVKSLDVINDEIAELQGKIAKLQQVKQDLLSRIGEFFMDSSVFLDMPIGEGLFDMSHVTRCGGNSGVEVPSP